MHLHANAKLTPALHRLPGPSSPRARLAGERHSGLPGVARQTRTSTLARFPGRRQAASTLVPAASAASANVLRAWCRRSAPAPAQEGGLGDRGETRNSSSTVSRLEADRLGRLWPDRGARSPAERYEHAFREACSTSMPSALAASGGSVARSTGIADAESGELAGRSSCSVSSTTTAVLASATIE